MGKTGKAYAFFDCSASKEEIEAELPITRENTQIPSELELSLVENPNENENLKSIARAASEGRSFNQEYDSVIAAIKEGKELEKYFSRFVTLIQRIDITKGSGAKYAMIARCPGADNEETAKEVADILNNAHQPPLYQKEEPFRGVVIYKEGDQYIFRE